MKKKYVLFILFALILSLSACGKEKIVEADAHKRLRGGEEVFVGFVTDSTENENSAADISILNEKFKEIGVTFDYLTANGDTELLINHLERYIARKADLIICHIPNTEAVKDTLIKAEENGVPVLISGYMPGYGEELSGGYYADWDALGYEMGKMVSFWLDEEYPNAAAGSVRAANFTDAEDERYLKQTEGLIRAIAEDPRISITFTRSGVKSAEDAIDALEESYEYDKDIKVYLNHQSTHSFAISGVLEDELEPGELELYGAFSPVQGKSALELADISSASPGIYRGGICFGIKSGEGKTINPIEALFYIACDVMFDPDFEAPVWVECDRWAASSFGYKYEFNNPGNEFITSGYPRQYPQADK